MVKQLCYAAHLWNQLPDYVNGAPTVASVQPRIKTQLYFFSLFTFFTFEPALNPWGVKADSGVVILILCLFEVGKTLPWHTYMCTCTHSRVEKREQYLSHPISSDMAKGCYPSAEPTLNANWQVTQGAFKLMCVRYDVWWKGKLVFLWIYKHT